MQCGRAYRRRKKVQLRFSWLARVPLLKLSNKHPRHSSAPVPRHFPLKSLRPDQMTSSLCLRVSVRESKRSGRNSLTDERWHGVQVHRDTSHPGQSGATNFPERTVKKKDLSTICREVQVRSTHFALQSRFQQLLRNRKFRSICSVRVLAAGFLTLSFTALRFSAFRVSRGYSAILTATRFTTGIVA